MPINKYRKPLLLSFLLLFIAVSCRNANTSSNKFYRDIDIFTLEGVGQVNEQEYPNVEVIDSAGFRVLKYHLDAKISFARTYHQHNESWETSFHYKDDTATIFTKRIVYPNKCLEFSYTDTINYSVYDIGLLEGDTMTYYNAGKLLFLKPTAENFEKAKENCFSQIKYTRDTSGPLVKIIMSTIIRDSPDTNYYIKCYPKNNRSFFWWMESKDYIKDLDCPLQ